MFPLQSFYPSIDFNGLFEDLYGPKINKYTYSVEDEVLTFKIPKPGIAKEDIEVSLENEYLLVKDKVKDIVIKINKDFNLDTVKAVYKDGLLTVTLLKNETKKARIINIA